MVPKVSSVVLENNTANDGSKILRVSGSNLDYVGSVVVNGCAFYTVKGGANQIPFYVEGSKLSCFPEGQNASGYLVWGKDSSILNGSNFTFYVPAEPVGSNIR